MKKPWLAFLLNFLIAGAGFGYLGKWKWAAINFLGVIAVGILVNKYAPDSLNLAAIVMAAGGASVAMSTAKAMNAKSGIAAPPQQV